MTIFVLFLDRSRTARFWAASGSGYRLLYTAAVLTLMITRSIKRKSLDNTGLLAAVSVGLPICAFSYSGSLALLFFFLSSSRLTRWKSDIKAQFEEERASGSEGGRNALQVWCNGGPAALLSFLGLVHFGTVDVMPFPSVYQTKTSQAVSAWQILGGILASLSAACADTWASEIGSALGKNPWHVLFLEHVPRGVNGAVSVEGLMASVGGGFAIGLVFAITSLVTSAFGEHDWVYIHSHPPQRDGYNLISTVPAKDSFFHNQVYYFSFILIFASLAGLMGSVLDSVLGAIFQRSIIDIRGRVITAEQLRRDPSKHEPIKYSTGLDFLTNDLVNIVMNILTTVLLPLGIITIMLSNSDEHSFIV
eukprot:Clim_evm7s220 gene=Clim_evmTU7s220